MKRQAHVTTILLFAASLLCLQQQRYHYCNAAAPSTFVKRRKAIITVPHLKQQIDTSSLLSSALSEDEGASLPLTTSAAGYGGVNTETTTSAATFSTNKRFNFILRGGGSNILLSSSSILSTITTILTQSLNIATAALVGSGYIGCYIASFIITKLHHYCTTAATITTTNNNEGSSLWKWKWTILATITHILSSSNNHKNKNLIFLPTLWGYSHQINPTLGGMIGCTHLLLGGLSSLLGSQTVVNTLSDLMDVRLPPLDDNGNMSYNIDIFVQEKKEEQSNKSSVMVLIGKEMLVRIFSSLDIFTSFPRDCLSLYLGSCTLLTYLSSMTKEVMGETKLGSMAWWMNGLLLSSGGGGQNGIDEDTAATSATAAAAAVMVVNRKMITMRLFALHWIVMVVKGTTSLLLQLL